jgi:plasmid stabilization system protein ParE
MKYSVIVTPEAVDNIAAAYDYIAQDSPSNAADFIRGVFEQIDGLEQFPRRFGRAREQAHFPEEIRQLIFKSYRIIFTIDDTAGTVHVVHVRHGKMRSIGDEE